MSAWLVSIAGTPFGQNLSMSLALLAALLHAVFGALQKGQKADPWQSRAAIDLCAGAIALPFVLFVVPWPEAHMWPIFAGMLAIHLSYKFLQAATYARGAYTVVYPVVRGSAPLFAVLGAYLLFGEVFAPLQFVGVLVLVGGIFGLAFYNLRTLGIRREQLLPALGFAVATGGFVALYTTYDAFGIRATADPFTFLAWFFLLDGLSFPLMIRRRWYPVAPEQRLALIRLGLIGSVTAFFSFGAIMIATRIGDVGQAAVLRETSTAFAALIGWLMLGERVGLPRTLLMLLIAAGAVIVQLGAAH